MSQKTAYETGARKYPARPGPDPSDDFSQDAATNNPPKKGSGNSEPLDDVVEKTRHSDGQNPPGTTPSPDMEKLGAGSAIAEHSKDAKAPKAGRQPGAYVKE